MDFRILGPLEVYDGERRVALGGAKQRALLGLLLLHANEVVSSDRLVDELWGEADRSKALQVAVSRLRKAIGPDVLVTRPPGYELRVERDSSTCAASRSWSPMAERRWTRAMRAAHRGSSPRRWRCGAAHHWRT
jgi:DNA-binding SARP family transcriptional activator